MDSSLCLDQENDNAADKLKDELVSDAYKKTGQEKYTIVIYYLYRWKQLKIWYGNSLVKD